MLIAKIATAQKSDWATNPGDTENLLRWMAENLNVHFSSMNLPEDQIPADPREIHRETKITPIDLRRKTMDTWGDSR